MSSAGASQRAANSRRKAFALGRMKAGAMNQTEAAYGKRLETLRQAGVVAWYKFEGMKLRLADNTFYSPDFAVMLANGEIEMHEVKGRWQEDARVKIKVAAEQYPFRFIAITKQLSKAGAGWNIEEF